MKEFGITAATYAMWRDAPAVNTGVFTYDKFLAALERQDAQDMKYQKLDRPIGRSYSVPINLSPEAGVTYMGEDTLRGMNGFLKSAYGTPTGFSLTPKDKVKRLSRKKLLEYTANLTEALLVAQEHSKLTYEQLGKEKAKTSTLFEVVRIATARREQ